MNKLAIFDKDQTLVKPASGAKFPQSPTDQILLPNVGKTIARYAADGWQPIICSTDTIGLQSIDPAKAAWGMRLYCDGDYGIPIRNVVVSPEEVIITVDSAIGFKSFNYQPGQKAVVSRVAEWEAIEELEYCLSLIPEIENAWFQPDGKSVVKVAHVAAGFSIWRYDAFESVKGMIQLAIESLDSIPDEVLAVGSDRLQALAESAGVSFQWAKDFFDWEGKW